MKFIDFLNENYSRMIDTDSEGNSIANTAGEISKFWKWFNGSVAVDNNGKPIVFYHGSNKKFDKFDVSKSSTNTGNDGHYGKGIYFTREIEEALTYGSIVYKCYLKIKKPFKDEASYIKSILHEFGHMKQFMNVDKEWLYGEIKKVDVNAAILSGLYINGFNRDDVWDEFIKLGGSYHSKLDLDEISDLMEDVIKGNLGYYSKKFIEDYFGDVPEKYKIYSYAKVPYTIRHLTDNGNYGDNFSKVVQSHGYDCIIADGEYVVFDPSQIRILI